MAGLFVLFTAAAAAETYPARPGEVVIRFRDAATAAERAAILADLGAADVKELRRPAVNHARVTGLAVEDAIRRYRGHAAVELIEPNYLYQKSLTPDDPRFADQWALENRGQPFGTPGADIDATKAWDFTTGSHDVLVAIVDTGIDYTHPDLAANVFVNPGEIPGNGRDDDDNGFVDDVRGWDFVNDDNDPFDDESHGTHVSGIVGASGSNGIGVVGVNWRVRILPVKFLDRTGGGTLDVALRSIDYAVAMGARVINASWGSRAPSEALYLAIRAAWQAGVVFVAAAGNSGSNNDIIPMFPASYYLPNIIAVAATDPFDRLPIWSSYGGNSVHIGAPGENIWSTIPGGYARFSGTSMATPHVTGAMGLILARYPWIAGLDARELLLAKADRLQSLKYRVTTGARLNLHNPMVLPDSIPPAPVLDLAASGIDGTRLTLSWSATGDDGTRGRASYYEVRYSTSPIDETNFASATRVPSGPPTGLVGAPEQVKVTGLRFATTYHLAMVVRDDYGSASPISNVVSVTTLGPPEVGVSVSSLSADLPFGQRSTATLALTNTGEAELNYAIEVRDASRPGEPADARVANPRVLLLQSGADVSEIKRLLAGFPDLAAVDELDGTSRAPTLNQLRAYHAVIVAVNVPFGNAAAVGDVLADYVDAGGVVVPTLASFTEGFGIGGRFQSGGYMPFTRLSGPAARSTMGGINAGHPLMAGVSAATAGPIGNVALEPGARLVASWANGQPMVATRGRVAGVNLFVGAAGHWSGDVPRLLRNAAGWNTRIFWLTTDSTSGVVPRGGQVSVVVTFDAGGLDGGEHLATVAIASDDPDESEVYVPARVGVTGRPEIEVTGGAVALESVRAYVQDGARTTHRLAAAVAPSGPGLLEVVAEGEYGGASETATVTAEGLALGTVGGIGVACVPARARFALDAVRLAALVADGVVEVDVQNHPYVGLACFPNQHRAWLQYEGAGDLVGFGPTFIGRTGERSLTIRNSGSEVLNVTSIVTDDPAFTADAGALTIPPRESRRLAVRFRPDAVRLHAATLAVRSDDPDEPEVRVALAGAGLAPPDVAVTPEELVQELPVGGVATRTLTIRNDGANALEFAIRLDQAAGDAGGKPALLVQDTAPWGSAANEELLAANGIAFDVLPTTALGSIDLARYGKVIVSGDQSNAAYGRLSLPTTASRIGQYVADGGVLEFHAAGWGPATGDASRVTLPGGMRIRHGLSSVNDVLDPEHPLTSEVPDPFTGSAASHGYFSAIPPGAAQLAADERGRPNFVVYPFGRGLVIAGGQKLEYGFVNAAGPGRILRNMIPYGFSRPPEWLTASALTGRVEAGEAVEVALRLDAEGLLGGDYEAEVVVESDDPDEATLRVPVRLRVIGVPRIAVTGSEVAAESTQPFATFGALTRHALAVPGEAAGEGTLEVEVLGDFGSSAEIATVTVEGLRLGEVGRTGADCVPAPGRFTIAPADLARMIADGVVEGEVRNTNAVDVFCAVNQHRLRLRYARSGEALEFGPLFVGACRSLAVEVENRGTGDLNVGPLAMQAPEFRASPAAGFRLPPGARQTVTVTFCPVTAGPVTETLVIRSDDSAVPEVMVRLAGEGVIPPDVAASPLHLNEALMIGERSEQRVRIANDGGAPLVVQVAPDPRPAWLEVEPAGGTIPPQDAIEVVVTWDGSGLSPGEHRTQLLVDSNDPDEPRLTIPIVLFAADVPARVEVEPRTIHLGRRGNWLTCHIELPAGADPAGVDVASLRLNHVVPAEPSPTAVADADGNGNGNGNGKVGLIVKFDFEAARLTLTPGEAVRVVVTGAVGGSSRLMGADLVRVIGPRQAMGGPGAAAAAFGDEIEVVREPALNAAPNPFPASGGTSIHFALPAAGAVDLGVYDIAGRRVQELASGWHPAGRREVRWEGLDSGGARLGPGLYFLRLRAPGFTLTRRIVLVR